MKVKLLIFLSLSTALAIVSSTIFAFSGKMSIAQTTVSKAYQDALIDAADSLPDEVLDNLTAIVESNPKLIWEGQPGNSRVLVATFTGAIGYESGQKIFPPSEIWVTVVPELKDFCTKYKNTGVDKNQLNLRLKQLLGLPPNREYVKVAEIWVHPQYLKRPTLDPEINDRTVQHLTNSIHPSLFSQGVDSAYQTWFTNQIKNDYMPGEIDDTLIKDLGPIADMIRPSKDHNTFTQDVRIREDLNRINDIMKKII
jgi:hypothetical protein